MSKKYISLLIILCCGISGHTASQNILSISDDAMNPTIIMPESTETDTRAMQESWYLKNYAIIDADADSRSDGDLSDEVISERLSKLPVTIEMPFNSVVAKSIRFYASHKQLVENMLGLSLYYMPIFEDALERHGLPRELKYLPVIESALDPTAKSRAGAGGLWQFMPATGRGLGLEQNSLVDMRFDPYSSSEAAATYLQQLYNTFNNWSLAIAAYNCGPGNINKALRRAGEGKHDFWEIYPFLPAETRGYFPAFIAANYIMTYHKSHNISPALARRPLVVDTVHVSRRVHFEQIAEVLDVPISALRALNPQYRQDVIPGDLKQYSLTLPSLQAYAYVAYEDSIANHNASLYARRDVVEPSTGVSVTASDNRGEYVEEETTQWHKVKRGETLASIASRYGVSQRDIRKWNRCGKKVKRGQRLKIKTVTRRYINNTPVESPTAEAESTARADSLAIDADSTGAALVTPMATAPDSTAATAVRNAFPTDDTTTNRTSESTAAANVGNTSTPGESTGSSRTQSTKRSNSKTRKARTRYHKVKRGENLTKIARRYGVTVAAIKQANNISGDEIQVGQRLKIPQ